jgi:hypothetical protein
VEGEGEVTVEVIDKGPHKSVVKQVICRNCGATLEYTPKDVQHKTYCVMGESDTCSFIVCPQCKNSVTVRGY